MKVPKLFIVALMSIACVVSFTSCEVDSKLDETENGIKNYEGGLYLCDFSYYDYPEDSDKWIISDTNATEMDFIGLHLALRAVAEEGRFIELSFPNLVAFPRGALVLDYFNNLVHPVITVDAPMVTYICSGSFFNCNSLKSVSCPSCLIIDGSFWCCTSLSIIDFPVLQEIITSEGWSSFYSCTSLIDVYLPKLKYISSYGFSDCSNLKIISIPEVTRIKDTFARGCTSLETLEIATNEGVKIEYFDISAFDVYYVINTEGGVDGNTDTPSSSVSSSSSVVNITRSIEMGSGTVDLIVGTANSNMVQENWQAVPDYYGNLHYSYQYYLVTPTSDGGEQTHGIFKSITVRNN